MDGKLMTRQTGPVGPCAHLAAAVYHRQLGDGIWGTTVPIWRKRNQQ